MKVRLAIVTALAIIASALFVTAVQSSASAHVEASNGCATCV